jgi:hypothetical protein
MARPQPIPVQLACLQEPPGPPAAQRPRVIRYQRMLLDKITPLDQRS